MFAHILGFLYVHFGGGLANPVIFLTSGSKCSTVGMAAIRQKSGSDEFFCS